MRIAIDIDSTLHNYWELFAATVNQRYGVQLDYEAQATWQIPQLDQYQVRECIQETHRDEAILQAVPYPAAVETVTAWYEAGHYIQISSHRSPTAYDATAQWLSNIDLPFQELCCSYDKVAHCRITNIDMLIDDSPVNLRDAHDSGIKTATLLHPWSEEVCSRLPIYAAQTWVELAELLTPELSK